MRQRIVEYLIGGEDDPNVLESSIPDGLLTPLIHIVFASKKSDLNAWKVRGKDSVLLFTQCHRWGQEPDDLKAPLISGT